MKNKSSKEMRKPAKTVICVLLNGSTWSTEKKKHDKIHGHLWYFLWNWAQDEEGGNGGEVQQRSWERMDVCSRRCKNHWREHWQWGWQAHVRLSLCDDWQWYWRCDPPKRRSLHVYSWNERRIDQALENITESMRRSADGNSGQVDESHETSWTGGMWCQHEPKDFRRGLRFKEKCMFIETSEAGITCRSKGPEDEIIARTFWLCHC